MKKQERINALALWHSLSHLEQARIKRVLAALRGLDAGDAGGVLALAGRLHCARLERAADQGAEVTKVTPDGDKLP